jgi:hypothetical protein
MMRRLGVWCLVGVTLLGTVGSAAESLRIVPLIADGEVLVTFELADAYTQEVRDAIASGLRTTFTYDVELRMPVAGWVDRTIATAVIATSSQYDNLTRRHTLSRAIDGRVTEVVLTDNESLVREWLTTLKRVPIYQTSRLDASHDYFVRIRARRRPSGTSLFGLASTITGQARFTFIP